MTKYGKMAMLIAVLKHEKAETEETLIMQLPETIIEGYKNRLDAINWGIEFLEKEYFGEAE